MNGANLEVTLTGLNSTYNSTFYSYKNGKAYKTFKTTSLLQVYTLSAWQSLVWNLTTNTISVINDGSEVTDDSILLLNYGTNRTSMMGYLANRVTTQYILNPIKDLKAPADYRLRL
jgi:hypothetical protein